MKKFYRLFIFAAVAALASCGDSENVADFDWFGTPQITDITSSTAGVECPTGAADGVMTPQNAGFSYAAVDESGKTGPFSDTPALSTEGGRIRAQLSGLQPGTAYRVHAYMSLGSSRITSADATFSTEGGSPDETVIEITSLTTLAVAAEGDICTVGYRIINPAEGSTVEAASSEAWVNSFDCSVDGEVSFAVDANTGAERTAAVTLSYPSAASRTVTVVQSAAGDTPVRPGGTVVLTAESGWPGSYSAETTCKMEGYEFLAAQIGTSYGNGIQFKGGAGYFANKDDFGYIRSIEVTYRETGRATLECFTGEVFHPTGYDSRVDGLKSDNGLKVTFDCAARNHRFFTVACGSGVSYVEKIVITYSPEQSGSGPDDGAPKFGTPGSTSVSKTGATVSCDFSYKGEGTVSALYFSYSANGGAEQRADVSTGNGVKSAVLSSLTPGTVYRYRLNAVVDGKIYSSSEASFTTASEQGTVSGDVYRTGWAELPTEVSNPDYYYAHHLCPDFTTGGHKARNYTVCFSAEHHCPVWVAAPRHSCYEGGADRTNAYGKDPDIPSGIQYNSKSTGGGCNKGHMLGSHERTRSTAINRQVFYYTNIAPQYSSGFNTGGGGWNTLEDWIDGKVCSDTTYLVIGTYFEQYTDGYGKSASPKRIEFGGRSDVSCPTMFYIAVLRTKRGNTGKSVMNCSKDELMCAAFVRAHNNSLKGQSVTSREMMSIADLERLTGFTFFANVPNAPKESYKASEWGL